MWKRNISLFCAAAAVPTIPTTEATVSPTNVEGDGEEEVVVPPVEWRLLPPYSWRKDSTNTDGHYFHGTTLGPRPVVALPGMLSPTSPKGSSITTTLDPFLRKAAWSHGALMCPMSLAPVSIGTSYEAPNSKLFSVQSEGVVSMLDYHGIEFAHLVAYSSGALLAIRLCQMFPDRVGSITLLDTPVITEDLVAQDKARAELATAKKDVNIPLAEIAAFEKKLVEAAKKEVEATPSALTNPMSLWTDAELTAAGFSSSDATPVALNEAIYEKLGPLTFSADFTKRDLSLLCKDYRELIQVRHPMMVVAGQKNSVLNVAAHQQYFNVRKRVSVKDVTEHKQLFHGEAADSVGSHLSQWLNRYELDTVVANKYSQAKEKLAQFEKLGLDKEGASAPADDGKGKKGKKGGGGGKGKK